LDHLIQILRDISEIDEKALLFEVLNQNKIKELIIKLNTQDQLFKRGIDSNGESLGEYTENTQKIKASKGQPFDRVTLKDTGEFYESWEVIISDISDIIINADDEKDDTALFEKYGEDVLGLTDESLELLVQAIEPDLVGLLQEKIFSFLR